MDVNRVSVRLMIICSKAVQQENVAHYLIRRGWHTVVSTSIKEAFHLLGQLKPDFVLLSVNLKSEKIFQIPNLLLHTFKIPVVTFGESIGALTLKRLQDIQSKYSLNGIASGPGVHRKIKSILQEIQNSSALEDKEIIERLENRAKKNINIQSEGAQRNKRAYRFTIEGESSVESKSDKLRRQYNERDLTEDTEPDESDVTEIDHLQSTAEQVSQAEDLDNIEDSKLESVDDGESDISLDELVAIAKQNSDLTGDVDTNITSREHIDIKNKSGSRLISSNETVGSETTSKTSGKKNQTNEEIAKELEDFILLSAQNAADKIIAPTKILVSATKCTVWPVISKQLAGFIVVSHGGSSDEENSYCRKFIESVREMGSSICTDFQIDKPLVTSLEYIDLKQTIEGELFTSTVFSGNSEIIIKLIKAHTVAPTLNIEPSSERARVKVSELVSELSPGADLFLHMPKNNRYFMYMKMDRVLSDRQKKKLLAGNAAIFINSKDLDKYSKTFAKNTAVQKIRDLKKKKAS